MKYQPTNRPKIDATDAKAWRKEALRVRKHLAELSNANLDFIVRLDDVMMTTPSNSADRKDAVATLQNALEMANDGARYFGLGVNVRNDKKLPVK